MRIATVLSSIAVVFVLLMIGNHFHNRRNAPAPTLMPVRSSELETLIVDDPDEGWDAIVACQKDPACAKSKQDHWDDIHAAPEEIAALKRRMAELEKRCSPSATKHEWTDQEEPK